MHPSATIATPRSDTDLATEISVRIEGYDLSRVGTYLQTHEGLSKREVEDLLVEYRRYMTMIALYPDLSIPIAGRVDLVWHTHILFTRDYAAFCAEIVGRFVHHEPTVNADERERLAPAYRQRTLQIYESLFGKLDVETWGFDAMVCGCHNNN